MLADQRSGERFAFGLTIIEAWFPVLAVLAVSSLGGLHTYFYSLIIAVCILFIIHFVKRKRFIKKDLNALFPLFLTSLLTTAMFAFIFIGLQYTSANNMAILMFMQVFFSYVYFYKNKTESLTLQQSLGAFLMLIGAMIVLFPEKIQLGLGDALIIFAAMIAPIANYWQKRSRSFVPSETILLVRSLFAIPVLFILAKWMEPDVSWKMIQEQWFWLFMIGSLVFVVAKLWWIEAIYLLSITKVSAIFAFSPMMTLALSYWILDDMPTIHQIIGVFPIIMGSVLITRHSQS
jgi:drug/metabolite transporter (DMT)-like permease